MPPTVEVYYVADAPTCGVAPADVPLPPIPEKWYPAEEIKQVETGSEGFLMGDQGIVGIFCTSSAALACEEDIFNYYDHPNKYERCAQERVELAEKSFDDIMAMEVKPDFICVGGFGTLIFQTVDIFRQLALPAVKLVIELATAAGLPTHIHSCGSESELVKIMAEESSLTMIDPLEITPMGNYNLAELKKLYGDKIILKGNLHTTEIMLNGSVEVVVNALKQAIAAGGGFTIDQKRAQLISFKLNVK